VSFQEAPGILHAIATHLGDENVRVNFLIRIGREDEEAGEQETCEEFRKLARTNLARHVVSKLLTDYHVMSTTMAAAETCVAFFALDPKHVPADNRDLKTLHDFLGRFYKAKGDMREKITDQLIEALVNARHYEFLIEHEMGEAAVVIYKKLLVQLRSVFEAETYKLQSDLKFEKPMMHREVKYYKTQGRKVIGDLGRMIALASHVIGSPGIPYMKPAAEAMLLLAPFCIKRQRGIVEIGF
jgi:hypothetical protein